MFIKTKQRITNTGETLFSICFIGNYCISGEGIKLNSALTNIKVK